MKERSIVLRDEEVRAVADGSEVEIRRLIKPDWWRCLDSNDEDDRARAVLMSPFGVTGDRLWGREAFSDGWADGRIRYRADFKPRYEAWERDPQKGACEAIERVERWRPSVHMSRGASRFNLEVVEVGIEETFMPGEWEWVVKVRRLL
jgi:hypothetical protein